MREMRLRHRPVQLLGAIRARRISGPTFADAAELDAYLWDKLSQTSNSRTVVYAKDLASS